MIYRITILLLITFLLTACTSKISKKFVDRLQVSDATTVESYDKRANPCNEKSNYIPDPDHINHTPMRQVRVNFHILCKEDGTGNFNEEDGRAFIKQVMVSANGNLSNNRQMALPEGNNTPVLPTRYRYVLTPDPNDPNDDGIYFHNDDELYYIINKGKHKNNYTKDVFKKYGTLKDTVLNVFLLDNHVDSLASPTYRPTMNGIAFSTWVKCSMWYHHAKRDTVWQDGKATFPNQWLAPKQLNHEIGHVLGLYHTWRGNDGCEDTPHNANCWGRTGRAPCDGVASNNVMDYNPLRHAWTPCQIGKVHYMLTQKVKKRNLLVPTWCELKESASIVIEDKVEWNSCKDLEGHITIKKGASLTIRCRVSLPKDAKITIHPQGKLILDGGRIHNDCGDTWQGIELWKEGNLKGEVILRNDSKIENATHKIEIE